MIARFRSGGIEDLIKVIRDYVNPGKDYILTLCQARTMDQNAYYHSVIIPLFCDYTGYTKREAHSILTYYFLSYINDGEPAIRSTSELDTIEFEQFCEDCRLFLYHEFNSVPRERKIKIPWPSEVDNQFLSELDKVFKY